MNNYKYCVLSEELRLDGLLIKEKYAPSLKDMDILVSIVCGGIKSGMTLTSVLKDVDVDMGLFLEATEGSEDYVEELSRAERIKSRVLEDQLVELSEKLLADGMSSSEISGIKVKMETLKYIMSISGHSKYSKNGGDNVEGDTVYNFISYDIEDKEEMIAWFSSNWNDSRSKFKSQVLSTSLERLKRDFDESS